MGVDDPSLNPKPESSMVFFFGWERERERAHTYDEFLGLWDVGSLQSVLFRVGEFTHWTSL